MASVVGEEAVGGGVEVVVVVVVAALSVAVASLVGVEGVFGSVSPLLMVPTGSDMTTTGARPVDRCFKIGGGHFIAKQPRAIS